MTKDIDLHEAEHAAQVLAMLRARVAEHGGFLPFDAYMRAALYAPGLGYYSAGARKLGAGGDFTTAPEISPLFGRCVAAQCEAVLRDVAQGEILELGAGSGRLACDVLLELARRDCVPRRYGILEVSADLRDRQSALLQQLPTALAARVQFLDAPPAAGWRGVLLANEVLDALPCQRFATHAAGVDELGVGVDARGGLLPQRRPASAALDAEVQRLFATLAEAPAAPYESELCAQVGPWIAEVTARLTRGVALFIDYGLPRAEYYHPSRDGGTLRCHYRHQAHEDPLRHPGLEDITAWVDFTRVAEAADDAGLEVLGYATQAAFLLGNGIEALIAAETDALSHARAVSQARQLLLPDQMGEAFKVIALGRGYEAPLAGFAHQDLRDRL